MSKVTVFQIVGMGHSGSTLLSALIGAHSRVLNVGEIDNISRLLHKNADKACSCGSPIAECSFWTELNQALVRDGYTIPGFSDVPEGLRAADKATIFNAIHKIFGAPAVIDSAKLPKRLPQMLASVGTDVIPVFLYAEPRKVVYSYMKKYGHSPLRRALKYNSLGLTMARLIFRLRRSDRRMGILSYEELTLRPTETIAALSRQIGLDFEPEQMAWSSGLGHSIAGNRMRFSADDSIVHDESWRTALTSGQKRMIALLCLPTYRLLAYLSRDVRRRASATRAGKDRSSQLA